MTTPTRKIATRMILIGQFQPEKLPQKKIPAQEKPHLDNSYPGKLPHRQLPSRKTPTWKIPTWTTPTQEKSHHENYLEKLLSSQLTPRLIATQLIW